MAELITLCLAVYLIPFIIALFKNRTNKGAIFALNFFLGWTGVGWVIALTWALTKDQQQVKV